MPDLKYVLPRVVRHFLPESAVSFLLKNRLIIQPGLETLSPEKAVKRYLDQLRLHKLSLESKRVMVFGYGGNLTIGCLLLEAGALQVVLCEKEGFTNVLNMDSLRMRFPQYFFKDPIGIKVNPKFLVLYHGDIAKLAVNKSFEKIDLVLSTSVFEHLKDPQQVIKSLAQLTSPNGSHLHFIDLRDHFFKYPFEMLCYTNSIWERWLNPTSNLNRFRISDYRDLFNHYFSETKIDAEERDLEKFSVSRTRIQKQFLSMNDEEDSTTQIHLVASFPK